MKRVSKQKNDPVCQAADKKKESQSSATMTPDTCMNQIKEIIDSGRRSAIEVVSEMMCITFEEVTELILGCGIDEQTIIKDRPYISNVASSVLTSMLTESKNGSLRDYLLGKNKASLIMSFLDFRTLSKEALQIEYKKAFEKWTLEEEMILTGLYNEGKSWKEISEHLQRNINAVKIRVEKLGLAEDTGAKRRY